MRDQYLARGYSLVYTPHVGAADLWKTSGPREFLRRQHVHPHGAGRRRVSAQADELPVPHPDLCRPAHSYRDLPVRLGELGTVYRYERSGVMHGLFRVRGFTQDDAHIFCTPEQIENEIVNCLQFAVDTLHTFGFDKYEAELSTWDGGASGKYDGTPEQWKLAESALQQRRGPPEARRQGDARRSGVLRAEDRREAGGRDRPPVAALDGAVRFHAAPALRPRVHRRGRQEASAADGAIARCTARWSGSSAFCIEHYAGAFPVWLAPVQAIVLPITDRQPSYAQTGATTVWRPRLPRGHWTTATRRSTQDSRRADAEDSVHAGGGRPGGREQARCRCAIGKHGDQGVKSLDEFMARYAATDRRQDAARVTMVLGWLLAALVAGSLVYCVLVIVAARSASLAVSLPRLRASRSRSAS